jgi:GT2 family glycosyltransferase
MPMVRGRLTARDGRLGRRYRDRRLGVERDVDWVSGACLLVKRESAADVGFFDERYFMYEEDVDLCAALRARGGRILYTPHAQVVHRRGRSLASGASRRSALYDRSHVAFYEKHAPHWAAPLRWWLAVRGRAIR